MALRNLLGGKIHRATITEANLDYEGSITLPPELMEAAGVLPNELVHVWNLTNGSRLQTYTMEGPRGESGITMNGAAAHLNKPGDLVIIAYFLIMEEGESVRHEPKIVFVDQQNRILDIRPEKPPLSRR